MMNKFEKLMNRVLPICINAESGDNRTSPYLDLDQGQSENNPFCEMFGELSGDLLAYRRQNFPASPQNDNAGLK